MDSLSELVSRSLPVTQKINQFFGRAEEQKYEQDYFIEYLYRGMASLPASEDSSLQPMERRNLVGDDHLQAYLRLSDRVIFKAFDNYIYGEQKNLMQKIAVESVPMCENRAIYYLRKTAVGAVLTHRYERHPLIEKPSFHVGFIGYDRNCLDLVQARKVKADILQLISAWNTGADEMTAWVFSFNIRSREFFEKLGLTPAFVRVSEKLK